MGKRIVKYNPAFLSKEELVKSFVVRHAELELIVQVLRENVTKSNQHILVIGPRGTGKTMLVLRAVEEVRREKDLSENWYPIVFSEESYQVTTPGEFWLEALFHLGQKTGEESWKHTCRELSREQDESRLRERALGQLMDFADTQEKRILLIVENFNMLLGEQLDDSDGWALRHTLLNEPRIMLLATATSRFEEVDNCGKPMFELLRPIELNPLDKEDCRTLWTSVTGKKPNNKRVRPLQILTGGNPRLLTIVSNFAVQMSLRKLMNDLMQLVDEHTEYFKSHLDNLPAIERKVYLNLAELWKPATAREVANLARLNVNKTSSLLRRLIERGAVVLVNGSKRTKLYQVAERMYNIYYLMRRRGAPSRRVKALVRFMANFYEEEELVNLTQQITEEACKLKPELRKDHFFAYETFLENASNQSLREKLIKAPPDDFFEMPDIPTSIKKLVKPEKPKELRDTEADEDLLKLLEKADDLEETGKFEEAEQVYRKAINVAPKSATAWASLGSLLHENLERYEEAERACRKAIELDEKYAFAWASLGALLHDKFERYDEAEQAYRKAIELKGGKYAYAWVRLGLLLHEKLERYKEAEMAYRKSIELKPQAVLGHASLGQLLHEKLERYDEAEKEYRKALELKPNQHWIWEQLGLLLHKDLGRFDEAEKAYRKAVELLPDCCVVWVYIGELLHQHLERYEEAEEAYRKAIDLRPDYALAWMRLGQLLHQYLERYEEAEEAYQKAIELKPDYDVAWARLGHLLHEKFERYEEAERAYRKATELNPNDAWAWTHFGILLHTDLSQPDEAEKAYRKAIKIDAKFPCPLVYLGELLQERKNYKEAKRVYKKAIDNGVDCSYAWEAFGRLLHRHLRQYEEAEMAYRRAMELEPRVVLSLKNLVDLLQKELKRPDKAIELVGKHFEKVDLVEKGTNEAIEMFVELAANSYGHEALNILQKSPSAKILEPLVVGLQLFVGEDVKAAAEIMEVAKDVVKRIEERQREVKNRKEKVKSKKRKKYKRD